MQIRDLIPWSRNRRDIEAHSGADNPLLGLQRNINRVFDDFWSRFDTLAGPSNGFLTGFGPRADVSETDQSVEVSVELPGMDEKEIDVSVTDDVLTIRGEKKAEREERKKGVLFPPVTGTVRSMGRSRRPRVYRSEEPSGVN